MQTRPIRTFAQALMAISALSFGSFIGCNGGSTSGGPASDDAGVGVQYVSDGGAGATIRIDVLGDLETGGTTDFLVTLQDPQGGPLPFVRVFCETESGIAILEPSSGGTSFESTNASGIMSGVLGGVTPGSYLLECRAEQGYNLVARTTLRVEGDVPPGFTGFPGAAGGNLGGGLLVEEPTDGDVGLIAITFQDVGGDGNFIDLSQNPNCDGDPMTNDPEDYLFNTYAISVSNNLDQPVSVTSIQVSAQGVTLPTQDVGTDIPAGGTATFSGNLTDFIPGQGDTKFFSGTSSPVPYGTYNVTFVVNVTNTVTGERFTLRDSQVLTAGDINNC